MRLAVCSHAEEWFQCAIRKKEGREEIRGRNE